MYRLPMRYPFRRLEAMQRALDRLYDEEFLSDADLVTDQPLMDMFETDDAVVVKAAVPGFAPENIEVSVSGSTLTIKGQVKEEAEQKERHYIHRERRMASFQRVLSLPHEVGADPKAEFENGVLTLTLPKPPEIKPRSITIQAK